MLISLRVKTLDSQDHEFSVENDITVRQFKERIKEKTDIDPDLQRLIYCGRVMNDEHPLSNYDVNGKVVHLVQRTPPGSTPRSVSGSNINNSEARNRRSNDNRNSPFLRSIDGMVVGAMAIPMNANAGGTQSIAHSMNPSSTLCMNRITVARHMLNCVDNIANYLEDPERGLNDTEMNSLSQQTMESTVFEVGISAVSDADVPAQEMQNLVQAFQGAVSAAFRQNGLSNITVDPETGTAQATMPLIVGPNGIQSAFNLGADGGVSINMGTASTTEGVHPQPESTSAPNASASATQGTATSAESTDNSASGAATDPPNPQQTTSPSVLAEVIQQMRTVQTRIDPFIQQYHEMLQNDPEFGADDSTARDGAQRVFDRVSEALHYLSHAQHAISDLMLDLSIATPRHLRCRPILVDQSFVSPTFMPNIPMMPRRPGTTTNNNEASATNNNTAAANAATAQSTGPTGDGSPPNVSPPNAGGIPHAMFIGGNPNVHVARIIQAVVNSVPANANVHVDFNPSGDTAQPQQQSQSHQSQPNSTPGADNEDDDAGEPDVVFRIDLDGTAPRVTTATHPTTATHTRSTPRPQAHAAHGIHHTHAHRNLRPVPIPTMQLSSFDRYLPCNSHHIREPEIPVHIHRSAQIIIPRPQAQSTQTQSPAATATAAAPPTTMPTGPSPPRPNVLPTTESHTVSAATSQASTSARSSPSMRPVAVANIDMDTPAPFLASDLLRLQVSDFVDVVPPPATLNRIRSILRDYASTALNLDTPHNDQTNTLAMYRVRALLKPLLDMLDSLNIAAYYARASVISLLDEQFPNILTLVLCNENDDAASDFGTQLFDELSVFWKRLTVILLHSIGRLKTQEILGKIIETFFMSVPAYATDLPPANETLRWLRRHIHLEMCKRLQDTRLDTVDVNRYLVKRCLTSAMETDTKEVTDNPATAVETSSEDDEPLPAVTFGTASWHEHLDASWLPIIERDLARQRQQEPQRAYSDAYLSGMSSKRRKLLTAAKPPPAEPNTMLGLGLRQVLQSRVVSRVGGASTSGSTSAALASTAAALNDAIAINPHIQEPHGSYEQALLNHVQNRVRDDADFNADRFPNVSKWIQKNK